MKERDTQFVNYLARLANKLEPFAKGDEEFPEDIEPQELIYALRQAAKLLVF